jgi:hypothetical protein
VGRGLYPRSKRLRVKSIDLPRVPMPAGEATGVSFPRLERLALEPEPPGPSEAEWC